MKFEIKHDGCCSHSSFTEIQGRDVKEALKNYIHEVLSVGDSCNLEVNVDGKWDKFYVGWTADISKEEG